MLFAALASIGIAGCGGDATAPNDASKRHGAGAIWIEDLPAWKQAQLARIRTLDPPRGPAAFPTSFDGRTDPLWRDANGNSILTPAWDQGGSDMCWAYSASTASSDRIRLANKDNPSGVWFQAVQYNEWNFDKSSYTGPVVTALNGFSPVDVGDCSADGDKTDMCAGPNSANTAYTYLNATGGVLFSDWDQQRCYPGCPDIGSLPTYKTGSLYNVVKPGAWAAGNIAAMQNEIYTNGPISTFMWIPTQFYDWFDNDTNGDVFDTTDTDGHVINNAGAAKGLAGHIITLVGWGETADGTEYWIVRNSWGQEDAENGYFKMLRGRNFCQMEDWVTACQPSP